MAQTDYYQVLGLQKGASGDEIKKAYRKLAVKYHPDKNQGDKTAEDRFKEINEAYAVLSDPKKKAQYDQFGASGFHQRYSQEDIFRGFDVGDMFKDMGMGTDDIFSRIFGGGFQQRGGSYARRRRGEDYTMELSVSLREAFSGTEKRVAYSRDGQREELTVKVPAGIESGAKLRIAGKGGPGQAGGPPGHIYLLVTVTPDRTFSREGDDLLVEVTTRFSEAVLGTSLEVPTMEGTKRLKVPAGIQPGTKLRLKGHGFPRLGESGRGDLYVRVQVTVPEHVTPRQRELVEELAKEGL
jgi:curved DNA-binding protein